MLVVTGCAQHLAAEEAAPPQRLIDRYPFDRITLSAGNGGTAIDVQLLDLPNRQIPQPFPTSGSLEIRRLSEPTTLYKVDWSALASVELFEQLVLQEAEQFTSANKLDEAYEDLDFLQRNYPQLPGLQETTEAYLQRDAAQSYSTGRYDESLAILSALHDLAPQHRGLVQAVIGVSNRMIAQRLENQDFVGARQILGTLRASFPDLNLSNIASWEARFAADAQKHLQVARQSIDQGDYQSARKAVRQSLGIVPQSPGAVVLLAELDRLAPQTVVCVSQLAVEVPTERLGDWATERVSHLLAPRFVELTGVGTEGGEYTCQWATLTGDQSGLKLQIELNAQARRAGLSPAGLSLALWQMAETDQTNYQPSFAAVFKRLELLAGTQVVVHWRYPPVQPLALLQFPLSRIPASQWIPSQYAAKMENSEPPSARFQLANNEPRQGPQVIIEQLEQDEEAAVAGLLRGEIDIWEDVPPWQADVLGKHPGIVVAAYRVPVVHVLVGNFENPLLGRREFRRALCYGIDRNRILTEVLTTKDQRAGFRLLSGPLPAGVTYGDPLGYAYNQNLLPLPYEPRLASVLHKTAQAALARRNAAAQRDAPPADEDAAGKDTPEQPEVKPLVLVHTSDSASQAICRLIKQQLDAVGIPIQLREATVARGLAADEWDLRYAQLSMAEPLVDARLVLGPGGLAGRCSPAMAATLADLDQAANWKDARTQLQRVHQLAYDDLPVIPLWQTVKYVAYRKAQTGIGKDPLTLYQRVDRWKKNYQLEGGSP
jgi:ABC-type transport system substrate-binding protein